MQPSVYPCNTARQVCERGGVVEQYWRLDVMCVLTQVGERRSPSEGGDALEGRRGRAFGTVVKTLVRVPMSCIGASGFHVQLYSQLPANTHSRKKLK